MLIVSTNCCYPEMLVMSLRDATVLVCEDEPFIAFDLAEELRAAGATVLHAKSVEEGLAIARSRRIDAAVLDQHLNDKPIEPVAQVLEEKGVPFLRYSGFVCSTKNNAGFLSKPAAPGEVARRLARLLPAAA